MNKFDNIKFPFFGIKQKPYQVKYDLQKIYVQRTFTGHLETVDDKSIEGDYFARLANLDQRLKFDYTCKNLQELIYSKAKWGMDCEANPFDLTKPMTVKSYCHRIVKVNDNLIWVKNISYPFKIPSNDDLHTIKGIYGVLVQYRLEWYIKEFTYDDKPLRKNSINL